MVLRVEFLKADDTPRYKTPLYLFWPGPLTVPLADLCRMYSAQKPKTGQTAENSCLDACLGQLYHLLMY
jgi:hypothetical protein